MTPLEKQVAEAMYYHILRVADFAVVEELGFACDNGWTIGDKSMDAVWRQLENEVAPRIAAALEAVVCHRDEQWLKLLKERKLLTPVDGIPPKKKPHVDFCGSALAAGLAKLKGEDDE